LSKSFSGGETFKWPVQTKDAGVRLDIFLSHRISDFSRTFLRGQIVAGNVLVDGKRAKVAYRLHEGQQVTVLPLTALPESPQPENIPLDILYEDEYLAAVNKPAGMVVHPAKGHWSGTLTSALAFHFNALSSLGGPARPGIVHRLDRDTSGVIVIAKTNAAHHKLAAQFEARTVEKEYRAIVVGNPDRDRDFISAAIGPHPHQREKMAIRPDLPQAKEAITFYEVVERFRKFALLRILPKTGRTHQVRVHLAHSGYPVLCDRLYGGRAQISRHEISAAPEQTEVLLDRQALHSLRLGCRHPASGQPLTFEAPLAEDIATTLELLRRDGCL
jgi:23S rRNA pseudouridine1911/1915/1917 synthase